MQIFLSLAHLCKAYQSRKWKFSYKEMIRMLKSPYLLQSFDARSIPALSLGNCAVHGLCIQLVSGLEFRGRARWSCRLACEAIARLRLLGVGPRCFVVVRGVAGSDVAGDAGRRPSVQFSSVHSFILIRKSFSTWADLPGNRIQGNDSKRRKEKNDNIYNYNYITSKSVHRVLIEIVLQAQFKDRGIITPSYDCRKRIP